jgi:hypothetical protein
MNTKFNDLFRSTIVYDQTKIDNGDCTGFDVLRDILMNLSNEQKRELLCDLLCINYHTDNESIFNELKNHI